MLDLFNQLNEFIIETSTGVLPAINQVTAKAWYSYVIKFRSWQIEPY